MRKSVFALILISIFASFTVKGFALPEEGLVLNFTFDANTIKGDTVVDLSEEGYDGTVSGGPKFTGGTIEFDGSDDYIVTPALDIRVAEKPFTAMGWFKTSEPNNGPLWMWGDNPIPSSSGDAEAPVGWRSSSGNFAAGFYSGGHHYAEAEEDYADGNWHFVAQVGEEDVGYLYIDGEQISSTTAGYSYSSNPYFIIGARTKDSGNEIDDIEYFMGIIDEIAIYNVALTEDEIQEIGQQQSPVSPSDKIADIWGRIKN